MRVFLIPKFAKFAKGEGITEARLRKAARGAVSNPDASLGGGLVKQRVARKGQGESGGYRAIIVLQKDDWALFLHGFAKNAADNIDPKTLKLFKELAGYYLALTDADLTRLVQEDELREIGNADEEGSEKAQ